MAAVDVLLSVAVAISLLSGHAKCEPKVLSSFKEMVSYLSSGAPVQINVDIKNCDTHGIPKELPKYSFSQKLDGVFLDRDEEVMTFNFSSDVNGSQYKLHGPATRLFEITITDHSASHKTTAYFGVKDFNPDTGAGLMAGYFDCPFRTGFIPVAGSGYGKELTTFNQLRDSLLAGHSVFFNLAFHYGDHKMFGQILDYRFDEEGALVFSRSFPVVWIGDLERAFMTVKNMVDSTVELQYYIYKFGSPLPPDPAIYDGKIGTQFHYFVQY